MKNIAPGGLAEAIKGMRAIGVVLFSSDVCPPCKSMNLAVGDLESGLAGNPAVEFYKVNTEEDQASLDVLNVEWTPTTVFVKGGVEIGRVEGATSAVELAKKLREAVNR